MVSGGFGWFLVVSGFINNDNQVYLEQVFVAEICEFHNKQLTSTQSFPPFGEVVQVHTLGGVKL